MIQLTFLPSWWWWWDGIVVMYTGTLQLSGVMCLCVEYWDGIASHQPAGPDYVFWAISGDRAQLLPGLCTSHNRVQYTIYCCKQQTFTYFYIFLKMTKIFFQLNILWPQYYYSGIQTFDFLWWKNQKIEVANHFLLLKKFCFTFLWWCMITLHDQDCIWSQKTWP